MAVNNEINLLPLTSNIIDGSNSETYNQLYFVGTGKTYVRKSDSAASIEVKSSGNFIFGNVLISRYSQILLIIFIFNSDNKISSLKS